MDIQQIKGIGEKTAGLFNRLSIYTVEDLLDFYPRGFDVYEKPVFIKDLAEEDEGKTVAVDGVVAKAVGVHSAGKFTVAATQIRDFEGNVLNCSWYNMPFLRSSLRMGERFVFRGHLARKNNKWVLEQASFSLVDAYEQKQGRMQPVYPLTKGLSNHTIAKAVKAALQMEGMQQEEALPAELCRQYHLESHKTACRQIHFPDSREEYTAARHRLVFEEFLYFALAVRNLKDGNAQQKNTAVIPAQQQTEAFLSALPYTLTGAQQRTWDEIKQDMAGKALMNRLIQGDVGSGKTILAVLAMMNAAFAGYQAALMAPTEVLAMQEYYSIVSLFKKQGISLKVRYLTGSMTASEKRMAYYAIAEGETDLIVGTHALIQEKVRYHRLGLVITDEQHRFGVNQRKLLSGKGDTPHVLVMSATPIPRTLALIVYGDLSISVVDELPAGRKAIRNCVVDASFRPKAFQFLLAQVKEGHQAYVICPMIEESESTDAENVADYTLKLQTALPDNVRIAQLHGKMKPAEKNAVMNRFAKGEIDILVSTTVIEVGVNVPNATVMMVENANRFGLAQLHQLRGRVGRGGSQSYCIFVSDAKDKTTMQRLDILNHSNDGFRIAEEDLKLRGPGDLFGLRQSGDLAFGIGDIFADHQELQDAAEAAGKLLDLDPELKMQEHALLKQKTMEYARNCLENINL